MKKATLALIASLVGITSYTMINNVSNPNAPQGQTTSLQFSKTYQHDSWYNVIGDPINAVKPVDSGLGQKKGEMMPAPDNSTIIDQLIINFEYAQYRDVPVTKLPDHLKIKVSPLLYLGHSKSKPQPYTPKFRQYAVWVNYMTDRPSFLYIQNGNKATGSNQIMNIWYLNTVRDVSAFVHSDWTELYTDLYFVLQELNVPKKLKGFYSGGEPLFVTTIAQVTDIAFKHTRYNKYYYNRIRPEELAGRIEFGLPVGIQDSFDLTKFKNHPSVKYNKAKYGTYLLPQAYPEGSPAHPDYTQGHTALCIAGIETIKRFYDTGAMIDDVELVNWLPTKNWKKISVNTALDQVCNLIGMGRVMNGVHFVDSYKSAVPTLTKIVNNHLDQLLK